MLKSRHSFFVLPLLWLAFCGYSGKAATISLTDILSSYAFTSGVVNTGTVGYNVWDDATGAALFADNGDLADIYITYTRTVPVGSPSGQATAFMSYSTANGGEFTGSQTYTQGTSNGFPTTNNPGTRIENRFKLTFASHLSITTLQLDFRSLNTAGVVWETSQIAMLNATGGYLTPAPTIQPYLLHTSVNGKPSTGWFQVDSKGTVSGVGTSATTAGSNGTLENLTATSGNSYLDYTDVGLATGTQVGGFEWISYLEDTRGIGNLPAGLTVTLESVTPAGTIIPEASTGLGCLLAGLLVARRRRRTLFGP
jgi:hypothetical protein